MIFLFTVFFALISSVLLLRTSTGTSKKYIIGILMASSLSIVSLIIYLNTINYYSFLTDKIYKLPSSISNIIYFSKISPHMTLRALNVSVISFKYFIFMYYFNAIPQMRKLGKKTMIPMIIYMVIQFIYFDKGFFIYIDQHTTGIVNSPFFYTIEPLIGGAFHFINIFIIIATMVLALVYYFTMQKITSTSNSIYTHF